MIYWCRKLSKSSYLLFSNQIELKEYYCSYAFYCVFLSMDSIQLNWDCLHTVIVMVKMKIIINDRMNYDRYKSLEKIYTFIMELIFVEFYLD
jgi:hypothetical protein